MNAKHTTACLTLALVLVSVGALAQRRSPRGRFGEDSAPKVGDTAPLFTLKSLDGSEEWSLGAFRDDRPVVLFFGSYT